MTTSGAIISFCSDAGGDCHVTSILCDDDVEHLKDCGPADGTLPHKDN